MNRLELIIASSEYGEYYEWQPYKDQGLYVIGETNYILYGEVTIDIKQFIKDVISYKKDVVDTTAKYYTKPYFDEAGTRFNFTLVQKGKEEKAINYICKDGDYPENMFYHMLSEEGKVLSKKKSKKVFALYLEKKERETLEGIANWVDDPKNFFNTFDIFSFANEHFDTEKELKPQYLALAKKHHPDITNDDGLMFRAIKRTYEYLVMK